MHTRAHEGAHEWWGLSAEVPSCTEAEPASLKLEVANACNLDHSGPFWTILDLASVLGMLLGRVQKGAQVPLKARAAGGQAGVGDTMIPFFSLRLFTHCVLKLYQ